jgi:hypothetical protein
MPAPEPAFWLQVITFTFTAFVVLYVVLAIWNRWDRARERRRMNSDFEVRNPRRRSF